MHTRMVRRSRLTADAFVGSVRGRRSAMQGRSQHLCWRSGRGSWRPGEGRVVLGELVLPSPAPGTRRVGRAGAAGAAGVSSASQQLGVGSPGPKRCCTHHQTHRTVPVCCLLGWPGTAACHRQKLCVSFRRAVVWLRATSSLHQTCFSSLNLERS